MLLLFADQKFGILRESAAKKGRNRGKRMLE
jgi:hypothetical protein